jgi:hypothetical protein
MNILLKALDDTGNLIFESCVAVDATTLIAVAEDRADLARAKGQSFTEGAIPFFAAELVQAAQRGEPEDELHKQSINVAMAAWLADSIYGGVSAADFVNLNLHFTLLPSGAVKYDRIRKSV